MPDTIRYGFIHSALCPLFTLSIRVLHSNAGHIQKKVTCYVPLSSSTGTYRQKVICYVPLSSNTGTYSGKVSCYVPLSISTGTYRQKIIYDVPLVLSCGTYKTIFLYMSQLYKKEGHNLQRKNICRYGRQRTGNVRDGVVPCQYREHPCQRGQPHSGPHIRQDRF